MKRAVVIAVLLLGLAGQLHATTSLEPPELSRFLRWGPVRVRPGIELSNLGYDDNILFSDSREKVGDYTATVSPKLEGVVLFGSRAFLTFKERLDYTVYFDNSDQNYLDNRTSARLTVPFRRMGVFADGLWSRFNSRPVDLEDTRPEGQESRYGVGVILTPGWRTEIEIGRVVRDLSYDDRDQDGGAISIARRLDRSENGTTIQVRYRILGRTRAVLDGKIASIEFDNPFRLPDDKTPIQQDTREWRLLGGAEFGEGGRLTGTVRLGWGEIDAVDPSLPDFSDYIGDAELVYRFGTGTRLRLLTERLPGFAVYDGNAYYLETNYGLRAVHYFNRLFGVESGIRRGTLTFPERVGGRDREDLIKRYDVGIRLRISDNSLGRRLEYSIKIGRYRRESTLPSVEQSQTTFAVGAVLGF